MSRRPGADHTPLATPPPAPAHEVVVSRVIDAPRERVFEAFTRPAQRRWLAPGSTVDFRLGGAFHTLVPTCDGDAVWFRGVHHEIVAPERIVYAEPCGGTATVTVMFVAHAGRTTVTLRHAGDPRVAEDGWCASLDRLVALLASG